MVCVTRGAKEVLCSCYLIGYLDVNTICRLIVRV